MNRLVIRLLSDDTAQWMLGGRGGRRGSGLPDPALAGAADEVVLIVPSEPVLLLAAPRISPRREELERGLAVAIEERLAAPVEQLHVAAGEARGDAGSVPALVAERRVLEAWLQRLEAAGLAPDRVLPESVLLPWPGAPLLWLEGERFVLRFDQAGACAGTRAELDALLARLSTPPARVLCVEGSASVAALAGVALESVSDPLARLAEGLDAAAGLDLLVADYADRRRRHGAGRRLWAWAAGLAAVALVLGLAQAALELSALQRRGAELGTRMESLYRELAPEASRVVDAEVQLTDLLARLQGRSADGALPVLARLAPALGEGRYALDLVEYREGSLELVVRGPDLAALDALREELSRRLGAAVELASAVPGQGEVEGRFRLRGGPA